MKWLEIIELRSVGNKRVALEPQLQDLINDVKQEERREKIKVYSHITLETDFSIHLYHDSQGTAISGTPLGQRLVSALKKFGLIHRSVWIEKHSIQGGE